MGGTAANLDRRRADGRSGGRIHQRTRREVGPEVTEGGRWGGGGARGRDTARGRHWCPSIWRHRQPPCYQMCARDSDRRATAARMRAACPLACGSRQQQARTMGNTRPSAKDGDDGGGRRCSRSHGSRDTAQAVLPLRESTAPLRTCRHPKPAHKRHGSQICRCHSLCTRTPELGGEAAADDRPLAAPASFVPCSLSEEPTGPSVASRHGPIRLPVASFRCCMHQAYINRQPTPHDPTAKATPETMALCSASRSTADNARTGAPRSTHQT